MQLQLKSVYSKNNCRTRMLVAPKMALHTAGGSAGSPQAGDRIILERALIGAGPRQSQQTDQAMTFLLPPRIAEYVVAHELAHLHEPHHPPAFWQRVERTMPDFERRKIWLAEQGMDVEGL